MTKRINFGEKYQSWSNEQKVLYLEKLSSSLNEALDGMQNERNAASDQVAVLEDQLAHCQTNLGIQKDTLRLMMEQHNEETQETAQIIKDLKVRVAAQDTVIESYKRGS